MSNAGIGQNGIGLKELRERLAQGTLNPLRELLPRRLIEEACRAVGYRYRQRLVTPETTILHLICAGLWPEESLQASWDLMWGFLASHTPGAAGRSPGSGKVAEARARLPLAVCEHLGGRVAQQGEALAQQSAVDTWRGWVVRILDGTCFSMSDNPALLAAFGTSRGRGLPGRFPLARMVACATLNSRIVSGFCLGPYRESERTLVWSALASTPASLLLLDRGFAGAEAYQRYRELGHHFLGLIHQRTKVEKLKIVQENSATDRLVELPIDRAYRKQDPALPAALTIRLIRCRTRNQDRPVDTWLATSLLDAEKYPAEELLVLVGRRWRIETLLGDLKVKLGADVLRSLTPEGIQKEVAVRIIALNLLNTLILKAAQKYQLDPQRISFVHALRVVLAASPTMALRHPAALPEIYQNLLDEIAAGLVPYRPGRREPRAYKRDRRSFPSLSQTRAEWRKAHVA